MHASTTRTLAPLLATLAFAAACSSTGHSDISAEPALARAAQGAMTLPLVQTKTLNVVKQASCSFTKIATLAGSVCAIVSGAEGKVACWGSNATGQLGDGTTTNRTYPAEVLTFAGTAFSGAIDITGISNPGYSDGTACALKSDGTVWCWGGNVNGSLGAKLSSNGVTGVVPLPVQVQNSAGANLTGVTNIYGGFGLCARKSDGTLWCWGGNAIADGIVVGDQANPAQRNEAHQIIVSGGAPLTNVSSAWLTRDMGCAVKTDKTAWCWGATSSVTCVSATSAYYAGQLNVPSVLNDLTQLSAGNGHFCATRSGGTVHCWGGDWNPYGQLADNTSSGTPGVGTKCNAVDALATGLTTLTGVSKVSSGGSNNCALKSDGRVYCWGNNDYGAIGDGTTTGRNVATKVLVAGGADFTGATDISVAESAACALKADGSAWCWGAGYQAGDGDPTLADNLNPEKVKCRECDTNADCSGATPSCDTSTNLCVPCSDNTSCTVAGLRACDTNARACVECVDDSTCTTGTLRHCDANARKCTECGSDADCKDPALPFCDGGRQLCVPCWNDDHCKDRGDKARPYCIYSNDLKVRQVCAECGGNWNTPFPRTCGQQAPICVTTGAFTGTCLAPCTGPFGSAGSNACDAFTPICIAYNSNTGIGGSCVACDGNATGATPAKCDDLHPLCLPSGKCVTCTAADSSRCVGATPYCDTAANVCVTEPAEGGIPEPIDAGGDAGLDDAGADADADADADANANAEQDASLDAAPDGAVTVIDEAGVDAGFEVGHSDGACSCKASPARSNGSAFAVAVGLVVVAIRRRRRSPQ